MKTSSLNILNNIGLSGKNRFAKKVLLAIFIIGLMAPVISNDKPLYVNFKGHHIFPAFHHRNIDDNKPEDFYVLNNLYNIDWKTLNADNIIFAPFTYGNGNFDYLNADYVSPFEKQKFKTADGEIKEMPLRYRHWLGTGKKGEDILAVLVYGARYTFFISFIAVACAALIGLMLGVLAGYFGNYHFKVTWFHFAGLIIGLLLGYSYGFNLRSLVIHPAFEKSQLYGIAQILISICILLGITVLFYLISDWISELFSVKKNIFIPVDSAVSRLIELFVSIPSLILIISFTAIMKPSLLTIILVIGLTGWPTIARLVRAEMMKIKALTYIEAAKAMGFSDRYIIFKHALPNISSALYVIVIYTVAAAIILESSLSFLGIGVPHDVITWGAVLAQSKENFDAWWISVFPGGLIFLTLYCLNKLTL